MPIFITTVGYYIYLMASFPGQLSKQDIVLTKLMSSVNGLKEV